MRFRGAPTSGYGPLTLRVAPSQLYWSPQSVSPKETAAAFLIGAEDFDRV